MAVVDPRQLALPFHGHSSSRARAAAEKKAKGRARETERATKTALKVPPLKLEIPSKKPTPKLPAPPEVHSPVPVSMSRLESALEKENLRRAGGDRAPDSTARGLPVGVRRGRLMPRSEQIDGNAPSSRSNNFDALERYLAGAGVVADAEALRGYLNPWLNGSDVLAFVPADRSAMIGASSVAFANQKKVIVVLPDGRKRHRSDQYAAGCGD